MVTGAAVLTRRGVADLQRLAGNRATGALIEGAATLDSERGRGGQAADPMASRRSRTLQRQVRSTTDPAPAPADEAWEGDIKGHLGENVSLRHTLNNFSEQPVRYLLRIHSRGHAMVSLETQYRIRGELQRPWIALYAQRGQTREVVNGLPPRSSLHLRFFGERDHTRKDQSYFEGTVEARRQK